MSDDRDVVIETLADSEAELCARVAALEADVQVYRALALAALDRLAELTRRIEHLTAQHHRLLDEYRRHRAQVMGADAQREAAA